MRIVNYDAQERVDTPDITAMSYLVLGEFRRHVRGLILGPGPGSPPSPAYPNWLIRGFAVEPQPSPDSTVRVRLEIANNPLGFAIGAENLASRIDHGQLVGGDDLAGQLEGNATQTLDFSAATPATYTVQMRFVYQDGANDNRAFWDAANNTEFISAHDTRTLPLVELRFQGSASDEWIDLADVVWDGASIDAADITDQRVFMLEGGPAGSFQSTSQTSGGYPDFDRSTDRAADGAHEIVPFVRAMARQVQDIKGQNDAGLFDVFSRPAGPYDPTSLIAAEKTKSLRTVNTVTYTIGDGNTTFGDFDGADGLEDCLQHLEDMGSANMPEHTVIVLKSNEPSGFTWNVNTAHTLNGSGVFKKLTIVGRGGGQQTPGHTTINFDAVPSGTAVFMNDGYLELVDIGDDGTEPANDITPWFVDGVFRAYRCRISGRESDGASSSAALGFAANGSRLEDCVIQGKVEISPPSSSATVEQATLIERCTIGLDVPNGSGCINVIAFSSGGGTGQAEVIVRDSTVRMVEDHGWGLRGAVDGENNEVVIENSSVVYRVDVDAVHVRAVNSVMGRIRARNCSFSQFSGSHSSGSGGNGADGTGWAIYIAGGSSSSVRANQSYVERCSFSGTDTIDAGSVFVSGPLNFIMRECYWSSAGIAAGGQHTCVNINGAGSSIEGKVLFEGNIFRSFFDSDTTGLVIEDVSEVTVTGNIFDGDDLVSGRGADDVAISLLGTTIAGLRIANNHFKDWEPGTDLNRCIVNGVSNLLRAVVSNNQFEDCGGYPVDLDAATYALVHGNTFSAGADGRAVSITAAPGSTVNDNVIVMGGTTRTAIDFGAASDNMASGNRIANGTFNIASGTVYGAPGGGGARTDLNYLT